MEQKQSNKCLIDYFRCSIPNSNLRNVSNNVLGIEFSNFVGGTVKGSPIQLMIVVLVLQILIFILVKVIIIF